MIAVRRMYYKWNDRIADETTNKRKRKKKQQQQTQQSNGNKLYADVGAIRPWNDMVTSGYCNEASEC